MSRSCFPWIIATTVSQAAAKWRNIPPTLYCCTALVAASSSSSSSSRPTSSPAVHASASSSHLYNDKNIYYYTAFISLGRNLTRCRLLFSITVRYCLFCCYQRFSRILLGPLLPLPLVEKFKTFVVELVDDARLASRKSCIMHDASPRACRVASTETQLNTWQQFVGS